MGSENDLAHLLKNMIWHFFASHVANHTLACHSWHSFHNYHFCDSCLFHCDCQLFFQNTSVVILENEPLKVIYIHSTRLGSANSLCDLDPNFIHVYYKESPITVNEVHSQVSVERISAQSVSIGSADAKGPLMAENVCCHHV